MAFAAWFSFQGFRRFLFRTLYNSRRWNQPHHLSRRVKFLWAWLYDCLIFHHDKNLLKAPGTCDGAASLDHKIQLQARKGKKRSQVENKLHWVTTGVAIAWLSFRRDSQRRIEAPREEDGELSWPNDVAYTNLSPHSPDEPCGWLDERLMTSPVHSEGWQTTTWAMKHSARDDLLSPIPVSHRKCCHSGPETFPEAKDDFWQILV